MRFRCSKCGSILVDTKRNIVGCVIYTEYDMKIPEIGMNIELELQDYIMCKNCGYKIPLQKLADRVKDSERYNAIVEMIRHGGKSGDIP